MAQRDQAGKLPTHRPADRGERRPADRNQHQAARTGAPAALPALVSPLESPSEATPPTNEPPKGKPIGREDADWGGCGNPRAPGCPDNARRPGLMAACASGRVRRGLLTPDPRPTVLADSNSLRPRPGGPSYDRLGPRSRVGRAR